MSTDKKRKNSVMKKKETAADMETAACSAVRNALVDSCHTYYRPEEKIEFSVMTEEDFPSLPNTPMKPPSKKGRDESADDIVTKLSELINMRSDKLESMVAVNTSHIAGLKEQLNSVCAEVNEVKT